MKKDKNTPNFMTKLYYFVLAFMLKVAAFIVYRLKVNVDPEVKKWNRRKGSYIILSTHPSELDAVVLLTCTFPRYTRFVAGTQQLYNKITGPVLRLVKVIPKKQFISDLHAIKEMLKTVKQGIPLAMMPEGRVSMDGTDNPFEPSTAKLIKKLGIPVAVLKPHGSYFGKPPYNDKGLIPGKVTGDLIPLFSAEDVKMLSSDEIYEKLSEAMKYDLCEEQRTAKKKFGFGKKNVFSGVSKIFYRCPNCGELYTIKEAPTHLFCEKCDFTAFFDRSTFFKNIKEGMPDCISAWNKTQLAFEKDFWKDLGTEICCKVKKSVADIEGKVQFKEIAIGTLRLNKDGLFYEDTDLLDPTAVKEKIEITLNNLPGVSADYLHGLITLYQDTTMKRFTFENAQTTPRFVNSLMVLKDLK